MIAERKVNLIFVAFVELISRTVTDREFISTDNILSRILSL